MEILVPIIATLLVMWADYLYTVFRISSESQKEAREEIRARANSLLMLKMGAAILISFSAYYFYADHMHEEEMRANALQIELNKQVQSSYPDYAAAKARRDVEDKKLFFETDVKARQGDPVAEYQLGNFYRDGVGVDQDLAKAVGCWGAAAFHGHVRAQITLGDFLAKGGRGVERDLVQAAKSYRMAARQGDLVGLQRMAECYLSGQGVVKDEVEAYAYYALISIRKGREDTNPLKRMVGQGTPLETLEGKLSQDQIAAGSRRANELQKEIDNY